MGTAHRSALRGARRSRIVVVAVATVALATTLGLGSVASARPRATTPVVTYFFVPSLHTKPWRIAPGPDGNMWFTDQGSDMIGKITPSGQVTEYDIGAGKGPYDVVAGRDGNIWFTEQLNDKVGAIDTSGHLVHEYYSPGEDSRPAGIAVGPNLDIYWSDGGSGEVIADDIGHLLPDGTVQQYQMFSCACFPIGITAGADGNLWPVEELGVWPPTGDAPGTIDKVSPDGSSVTRYRIPAPAFTENHLPAWDAPGPDGNVWFTELDANLHQIGVVTPSGTITEHQIPGPKTDTGGIATGFDGNLWVTEPDANQVAVVSPSGSLVQTIGVHQEPLGITMGPDGNMWFVNALSGEIGRISTAQSGHAYVLDIAPGFVPAARAAALGTTVEWVLESPGQHGVQDATGLGLYATGPRSPVSFATYRFTWAGSYPYVDGQTKDAGMIGVPVNAPSTDALGHRFTVTWALAAPPASDVFDVQFMPPGASSWTAWKSGTTSLSGGFTPTAPGTYGFRARIRNGDGSARTKWSPTVTVTVS